MPHHAVLVVALAFASWATTAAQATNPPADLYDMEAYRDFHFTFSQPNWWALLQSNRIASSQSPTAPPIDLPADLTVDGITYPNVGVRIRGNTSYTQLPAGSEKVSLNVSMDAFVPNQELLGYDSLNLNNGFHDPTFVREFLTYYLCRRHGIAPGCNFVRVFLNGVPWGVYINVQQPDKTMMGQWMGSDEGNRYRGYPTTGSFANGRTAFTWLGPLVTDYLSAYQAKRGNGIDLMLMCDAISNTPAPLLPQVLPNFFNVDQFFRYAACMNLATQTDSYIGTGKDHFLFVDDVHGDFYTFPFDLNEALRGGSSLSIFYNSNLPDRPALSRLLAEPAWRDRYIAHYRTILQETFTVDHLATLAYRMHQMIAPDVVADTRKIYSTQAFFDNLTQPVQVFGGFSVVTIPGLEPFLQQRTTWLGTRSELMAVPPSLSALQIAAPGPVPNQPTSVNVTASSDAVTVDLYYRTTGPFQATPMYDDGLHNDGLAGDGVFGASIPPAGPGLQVDYYATAQTALGTMALLPSSGEFNAPSFSVPWLTAPTDIAINEFLASNVSTLADPAGEFDDYVELYNRGSTAVDLSGHYLTDSLSLPTRWSFPQGTTIPPQGTLLVWCDDDVVQGPLHANFKLSAAGETIALLAPDGVTLLDRIDFGPQLPDIATKRLMDGANPWVTSEGPTPNQLNVASGCGSRPYSSLAPWNHTLRLVAQGSPAVGAVPSLILSQGSPAGAAEIYASPSPGTWMVTSTLTALVDLSSAITFSTTLDAAGSGAVPVPIPNDPSLVGVRFYLQGASLGVLGLGASNGLEVTICP